MANPAVVMGRVLKDAGEALPRVAARRGGLWLPAAPCRPSPREQAIA